MVKKYGVTSILILHLTGMFIYFWRMSHDIINDKYPKGYYYIMPGWATFYFTALMLPHMLLCFLFASSRQSERCIFDNNFLLIDALFTLSINIAIFMQMYNLIEHTYGLQITILGIIATTAMIAFSASRHGFYKD